MTKFQQTSVTEGKMQPEFTFFFMWVLLVTYRSPPYLHLCGGCGSSENCEFWV